MLGSAHLLKPLQTQRFRRLGSKRVERRARKMLALMSEAATGSRERDRPLKSAVMSARDRLTDFARNRPEPSDGRMSVVAAATGQVVAFSTSSRSRCEISSPHGVRGPLDTEWTMAISQPRS